MVEGKYKGTVKTPLGVKNGIVTLNVNGDILSGTIEALGKINPFRNGKVNGNKFYFTGTLKMMLGKIDYKAEGIVEGDTLKATVIAANGTIEIVAKRV